MIDFRALLAAIDDKSLHAIINTADSLPSTLPAFQAAYALLRMFSGYPW